MDTAGTIYTSLGLQTNIDEYSFDYKTIREPEISIFNLNSTEKKVIIAVPVDLSFEGKNLRTCFMEIDMKEMLSGVSMDSTEGDATFCNIYTKDGIPLTDTILGGLAVEDNLLEAMKNAVFENGYSYEAIQDDVQNIRKGQVSFAYDGVRDTLSYVPVAGTDWLLTYLIRESVITDEISGISQGMIQRSIIQSVLTVAAMFVMFSFIFSETRKSAQLQLDKEISEAELKGKNEELEHRIGLQKQLEEQSQALSDALGVAEEASRAKTAFLSNMSHEIRTPMNAIIGLDNIALNDPETPEKTKDYLRKIGASADHLLSLINDILDMSRIESGRMTLKNEEFSLQKLLEAINTMFSSQCQDKGLDYQCHIRSEVDDYYIGDNMKLRQVLINILGNAVKFTPEGGKVELDVERIAQYEGKTALKFVVSDTGVGMSKDFLPKIFDAFAQEDNSSTNKYGSSGLGMAITKNTVEMMNGNIEVESEKGKGSIFRVTVTLQDSNRKGNGALHEEIVPSELTVLIIDDDPVACEHAKLVLEKASIASETALSGTEAIEMVRIRHARRNPYNLILVDWKMPEMDGVETTRKIREIVGNESAIIILTAYRWDDVLEEALSAGVDSFIPKPVFAQNVLDEFRSSLIKKSVHPSKAEHKVDLMGKRILVAEDVEINAEIIMMLLNSRGMEVEHAENGKIAVEMFTKRPENYYDAILMDLRMPEMDGLEATKAIRSLERKDRNTIPIIALTANAFDEDVQRSLQAGLNAHLSKPVQPEDLYKTLESLIQE
ncbi:MAG: response regulator [Oscillospiraceae bacterium]|nr:response regulator [Oscillospiraceae bacterium]